MKKTLPYITATVALCATLALGARLHGMGQQSVRSFQQTLEEAGATQAAALREAVLGIHPAALPFGGEAVTLPRDVYFVYPDGVPTTGRIAVADVGEHLGVRIDPFRAHLISASQLGDVFRASHEKMLVVFMPGIHEITLTGNGLHDVTFTSLWYLGLAEEPSILRGQRLANAESVTVAGLYFYRPRELVMGNALLLVSGSRDIVFLDNYVARLSAQYFPSLQWSRVEDGLILGNMFAAEPSAQRVVPAMQVLYSEDVRISDNAASPAFSALLRRCRPPAEPGMELEENNRFDGERVVQLQCGGR